MFTPENYVIFAVIALLVFAAGYATCWAFGPFRFRSVKWFDSLAPGTEGCVLKIDQKHSDMGDIIAYRAIVLIYLDGRRSGRTKIYRLRTSRAIELGSFTVPRPEPLILTVPSGSMTQSIA